MGYNGWKCNVLIPLQKTQQQGRGRQLAFSVNRSVLDSEVFYPNCNLPVARMARPVFNDTGDFAPDKGPGRPL